MKLRYLLSKAYLNRSVRDFDLSNIEQMRRSFDKSSRSIHRKKIRLVRDYTINNGTKIRYYRNNTQSNKLPVVAYFHGGGFVLGGVESHDSVCRNIAKYNNCVVVSVGYGLAPEQKHHKTIDEGLKAIEWLANNAELEGLDRSKIFLAGDSAGGLIALNVAIELKGNPSLKGLVLIYPTLGDKLKTPSIHKYSKGYFVTKDMLKQFWNSYLDKGEKYNLPPQNKLSQIPSVLIIAAEKDLLVDEGHDLAKRLRSIDVPVEYRCYPDMLHGFMQFPRLFSHKSKAFAEISRFINKGARL